MDAPLEAPGAAGQCRSTRRRAAPVVAVSRGRRGHAGARFLPERPGRDPTQGRVSITHRARGGKSCACDGFAVKAGPKAQLTAPALDLRQAVTMQLS
jgi:hypothetical protein